MKKNSDDETKVTYAPYICDIVSSMMEVGATLDDIIGVIGIDKNTLDNWRHQHPMFDKTIKEGLIYAEMLTSLENKKHL